MKIHQCSTEDGISITCLCVRGQDHNEAEYDQPVQESTND